MSMRDYAVDDYGLVLNSNIMNVLAVQLYDDCTEQAWKDDKYEFIEGVADSLGIERVYGFTGEAFCIDATTGEDVWSGEDIYNDDSIYYVSLSRRPTLFGRAYTNIDDIVAECKQKIGKYLPENFQYRENIRHIVGTYYG